MSTYLDASIAVALFTPEAASARIRAWAGQQPGGDLAISRWVAVEVASALSIKVRTGALAEPQRSVLSAAWTRFCAGVATLPVEADHFATAELWAGQPDLALRAGDALHIAVARANGCALATLDRRMAEAAGRVGVPVASI